MPILYFRSKKVNAVTLDYDGIAVASLKAARAEGVLTFADILREDNLREDNQEPFLAGKPLRL